MKAAAGWLVEAAWGHTGRALCAFGRCNSTCRGRRDHCPIPFPPFSARLP